MVLAMLLSLAALGTPLLSEGPKEAVKPKSELAIETVKITQTFPLLKRKS